MSTLSLIDAAYVASLRRASRRFARATRDVAGAQRARLAAILARGASTAYGRAHGLRGGAEDLHRLPIVGYDELRPWIDRIAAGERRVLTPERVRVLEPTSGSTGAPKLVPYCDALRAELSRAIEPWLHDLYTARPALRGTRSYFALSPVARGVERTPGGVKVGFVDDTEYFGPLARWAWRAKMAVPASVAHAPDVETWRRQTALHLLAAEDLGFVSVWSPTLLTLLMRAMAQDLESLLGALPRARADAIRRAVDRAGRVTGRALWPRLTLVSCWADGTAALFLPELAEWLPEVELQPKGLLATEGVVSIPLFAAPGGHVLAVDSHFYELEDADHPAAPPRLAHELAVGGRYTPLLTTSGGLYRYRLNDVVACVGHHQQAPVLRLEGKRDRTSDLCGEKLDEAAVERALASAARELGARLEFALVAPALAPARYVLYVETSLDDARLATLASLVEERLRDNFHYRYCRELGQLGALGPVRVRDGWRRFEAALASRGARLGTLKAAALDSRTSWAETFGS